MNKSNIDTHSLSTNELIGISPSLNSPSSQASCGTDPCSQYFLCFTEQLITGCNPKPLYNGLGCLYLETKQWTQTVCLFIFSFLNQSLHIRWLDDQNYNSLSFHSLYPVFFFPCCKLKSTGCSVDDSNPIQPFCWWTRWTFTFLKKFVFPLSLMSQNFHRLFSKCIIYRKTSWSFGFNKHMMNWLTVSVYFTVPINRLVPATYKSLAFDSCLLLDTLLVVFKNFKLFLLKSFPNICLNSNWMSSH